MIPEAQTSSEKCCSLIIYKFIPIEEMTFLTDFHSHLPGERFLDFMVYFHHGFSCGLTT